MGVGMASIFATGKPHGSRHGRTLVLRLVSLMGVGMASIFATGKPHGSRRSINFCYR
jgi:hypothetical protein